MRHAAVGKRVGVSRRTGVAGAASRSSSPRRENLALSSFGSFAPPDFSLDFSAPNFEQDWRSTPAPPATAAPAPAPPAKAAGKAKPNTGKKKSP
jgi:hypothetical protein